MFGPLGKAANARSRWSSGNVTCKGCHKRFDVAAASRRKAPAVRRGGP